MIFQHRWGDGGDASCTGEIGAAQQHRLSDAEAHADEDKQKLSHLRVVIHVAAGDGGVAAYASLGDEPGTAALRALLALSGVRVLLPVIRDDGGLDWGWDSDELVPRDHRLAIPEPAVDSSLGTGAAGLAASGCAVVLVPALAIDRAGFRLGQGGGYYDRLLADVPRHADGGPLLVAVVHDDELVDALPHEPHDRPVDAVLTPSAYLPLHAP